MQTPLEIRLWSEAALPAEAVVAQSQLNQAKITQAALPKTDGESLTTVEMAETPFAEEPRPDFDLASIALSAPRRITTNIGTASPIVRISRPDARASSPGLTKAELVISAAAPLLSLDTNRGILRGIGIGIVSQPNTQRPHETGVAESAEALETWSGSETRRQFLAAHAEMEVAGPQIARTTRPPAVSAAGLASTRATNQIGRKSLKHSTYGTGWQEVPLEELPDCSPAGRQDLLKKRILLAAPFERECSHQGGSYRFVETRNLGAFLMWSRTNPDRPVGQPRARNVCDVLERALRCLDASSIEESSAQ